MNRRERRKQRSETGMAPATPEALFRAAFEHHRAGRPKEARALYARALAGQPDNPELLHMAGVAAYEEDDLDAALRLIGKALERGLRRPEVHNNLANALQKSGRAAEAEAAFREALNLAPGYADAHYNLGNLLKEAGRLEEAIEEYERALRTQPNDAQIFHSLGLAYQAMGLPEKAAGAFRRTVEIKPDHEAALLGFARLLRLLGQPRDAVGCFRRFIALIPTNLRVLMGFAEVLELMGKREETLEVLRTVLAIEPSHPQANCGYLKMLEQICAWEEAGQYRRLVRQAALETLERGESPAEESFDAMGRDMDPIYLLRNARAHSQSVVAATNALRESLPAVATRPGDGRITLGYLSSDFRNHPVGHLVSGLFSRHDRNRFRVIAYSAGPDDGSAYRHRVESGCDAFVDLVAAGTAAAAQRIREDGVDILIDLNGLTTRNRLDVLALKPAAVQVGYLGYPGTTGADFMDYVIGDSVVAPMEHARFFAEKLVHLPGCYMVTSPHPLSEERPARRECGLPDDAVAFCSFCRNEKIEPIMFRVWMDILRRVPNSVLWLADVSPTGKENLRRHAEALGVAATRLVFAARLAAKEDHLARSGLADLALDTRIFGGHTTTSDMLWAGVPVISLLGGHFASRVGASLLKAIGLEQLVTHSLDDYRELAVRLARDRGELAEVRRLLNENRERSPLFDTVRFARNLERGFEQMWARHRAGLEPASFAVVED
ncbi:O-linked N-acetylglucosamine transferase, SPINDLY family protein [Shumkonia mesophila]|uniref:O-linked N-acetylglucosamine transferase, SPINDLY family protein n=1 Tax=Shumkonia mesophila TaxID=2838854 RepID=UPI0029350591|nr:tetratricopeptide repeat protein [Shumkonia mesophila]